MEKQQIDLYLTANAKYFEASAIPVLRQKLEKASDDTLVAIQSCDLKDPTTMLLVSIKNLSRNLLTSVRRGMLFFLFLPATWCTGF